MRDEQENGPIASRSVLGLMAKYWQPGRVKTRLAVDIGDAQAAELHRLLVEFTLRHCAHSASRQFLVFAPDEACGDPSLAPLDSWEVIPQGGGGLGERMMRFMRTQLAIANGDSEKESAYQGVNRAVLIGADCPYLTRSLIEEAFQTLDRHDVVFGPADDGGYYLIGIRGPWRGTCANLFAGMDWGTNRVADQTRAACLDHNLSWSELQTLSDVDYLADLETLFRTSKSGEVGDLDLRKELDHLEHQIRSAKESS